MTGQSVPQLSVISVTRNDLPGLMRTWASLVSQTWCDFEWVVVDGASSDGTAEWLARLDDSRLTWVSEPDRGTYDAMNKGIRQARGALLQFLNAGDFLASDDVLERVACDHHLRRWEWAFGIERFLNVDGQPAGAYSGMPFRRRLLELGYRYVPHPTSFFSSQLVTQLGGYDLRYPVAADQEFIMRAARLSAPSTINEVLVHFAVGGVSTTQPPDSFVWQARQIRMDRGWLFGGSRAIDLAVSSLLAAGFRWHARTSTRPWDRDVEPVQADAAPPDVGNVGVAQHG